MDCGLPSRKRLNCYKKVLDDLFVNQEKLTKTELVKVFVTFSNYIFPKTKPARDKFTLEQLKRKSDDFFNQNQDPYMKYFLSKKIMK